MTESDPTARMTTLSMLGSACAFEAEASVPLYCISNLAALIELLCLYETTYVLGSVPKSLAASEFIGELLRIGFVRDVSTRRIRGAIFTRERIGAIAAGRLDQVLGIGMDQARDLVEASMVISSDEDHFASFFKADIWRAVQVHRSADYLRKRIALMGLNDEETLAFVRVFVYVAYSEASETVFSPDFERIAVTKAIIRKDEEFRGQLLSGNSEIAEDGEVLLSAVRWDRVTPFASIVFERANGRRDRLIGEAVGLRDELANARRKLYVEEVQILDARTKPDELVARKRWEVTMATIKDSLGGTATIDSAVRSSFNFAASADKIIDNPKSIAGITEGIKLSTGWIRQALVRRHFFEFTRLSRQVPSSGSLRRSISRLFNL